MFSIYFRRAVNSKGVSKSIVFMSLALCLFLGVNSNSANAECTLKPGNYTLYHTGASRFTRSTIYKLQLEILSQEHFILESNWKVDTYHDMDLEKGIHTFKRSWTPSWLTDTTECERMPSVCSGSIREQMLPALQQAMTHYISEEQLLPVYIRSMDEVEDEAVHQARCLSEKLENALNKWNRAASLNKWDHWNQ